MFVVLIFQRRTDKAGGEEVAVAQEIQEGNILSDTILLLLLFGAFLSRKGPVFDVVSQKGVFAGEDHQESFCLHAPSAIVGEDLV